MPISIVEEHPYSSPAEDAHSTLKAMARVRYSSHYDLGDTTVYDVAVLARVWIVPARAPAPRGDGDVLLFLYPVVEGERSASADAIRGRTPIGVLRPAQRYVTSSGIARARRLSDVVVDVVDDPWGCVLIEGDGQRIWITPPILELLHPADRDPEASCSEFIVCDGNHRIVDRAWRRGIPTAAVAALESPAEPYYILPLPPSAWQMVSDNEVLASPPREEKYTTRPVELPSPDSPLRQVPAGERYRRYIRALETGFGNLGGQAGSPQ